MSRLAYRAVTPQGLVRHGVLAARTEAELESILQESGLTLIEARTKPTSTRPLMASAPTFLHRHGFCGQMADLLGAGFPFLESLKIVCDALPNGPLADGLRLIARDVAAGDSPSAAFAKQSALFEPVFSALLRTGEATGDLAGSFRHLKDHLAKQEKLTKAIRRALGYPLFLFVTAVGTMTFMMTVVVPQIVAFLAAADGHLPFFTQLLLETASVFSVLWPPLVGLSFGLPLLLALGRRFSGTVARRIDAILLSLPWIGPALWQLSIARFLSALAVLLQNGLSLPISLATAQPILGNLYLQTAAREGERRLTEGIAFSEAFGPLLPPFAAAMIRIAENSGKLPKTLADIASFCDERARESLERGIGLLEPCLTLAVGSLLAWIVLAVLGPLYANLSVLGAAP